jgi:2-polyprenyl-3-methyl-5-hydroxy-6-metoxy-1,4-benzoquinol methylase
MDVDAQTMARLEARSVQLARHLKPCPLCGRTEHDVVGTRDRDGRDLRTVMCQACGHVFTNPAPNEDDLKTYYTEHYRSTYKGVLTPKRKHVLRAGYRALERLSRLRGFLTPPAKVLDVGAGGGEFAYLLSCTGYDVVGVEPNAGYASFASQSYGLDIRATTLELIDFPAATFDAITMHHVLEHIADPSAALKRLACWLKPGGLMVVEVPNVMSWFHAPRRRFHDAHLHTFNHAGLEDIFTATGFKVESLYITPGTAHLNIVAREQTSPTESPSCRNATSDVAAHFKRHTEIAHVVSGMAFKRIWGNAVRPWRERQMLVSLGNPTVARDILDRLFAAKSTAA